jgi:hypothetical protein
MLNAAQPDDTRLIDSPSHPPSVAVAAAWHRYQWALAGALPVTADQLQPARRRCGRRAGLTRGPARRQPRRRQVGQIPHVDR